jgi:hypothetical protein
VDKVKREPSGSDPLLPLQSIAGFGCVQHEPKTGSGFPLYVIIYGEVLVLVLVLSAVAYVVSAVRGE